jgi:G3E family GTPase
MTVPLIIVTGFLGAGKTTLINRVMAHRRERGATGKIGVIVNELGEIGIDGTLLGGETARQIELPGGCVCCVLGEELDATLIELVDTNPGLEAIVLETTGVAEPLPIAWAVERDEVARRVRLAAVVTMLDAVNFLASRSLSASVDAQVAYADVLLVTKAELTARTDDADRAEAVAREIARRALIRRGSADEHATWLEALLADPESEGAKVRLASLAEAAPPYGQVRGHVHSDDCRHLDSAAAHGIDSVWVHVPHVVDLEELEDQLGELPANYVRIKGIVKVADSSGARWVVVHRVGPRVSSEVLEAPATEPPRQAHLVALGRAVDQTELARCVAIAAT